ncbi:hypothetical protein HRbin10_00682 [bacterium HR10]|nr:hypothetical protein HRbin10_00682 [bacterium HR10]
MRVAMAADHAGFLLERDPVAFLKKRSHRE